MPYTDSPAWNTPEVPLLLVELCQNKLLYCTISINLTSHASQGPILVEIHPLVTGHRGCSQMGSLSTYPIWVWHASTCPKLVEILDHVMVTGPCGRTCLPKHMCHGSHPWSNWYSTFLSLLSCAIVPVLVYKTSTSPVCSLVWPLEYIEVLLHITPLVNYS